MKSLVVILFLLIQSTFVFAETSNLISIDDDNTPPPYVDVFEETLPLDLNEMLNREAEELDKAPITAARASELFNSLKRDPRARMRRPGGLCSTRRVHIKSVLRSKGVTSGRLLIRCPGNNGRLRVRDQVSGHYFTYSNFHDTNVVVVGGSYRVMDVQFESGPVSLPTYLGKLRAYQRNLAGINGRYMLLESKLPLLRRIYASSIQRNAEEYSRCSWDSSRKRASL